MENVGNINCNEAISGAFKIIFCPVGGVLKWIKEKQQKNLSF